MSTDRWIPFHACIPRPPPPFPPIPCIPHGGGGYHTLLVCCRRDHLVTLVKKYKKSEAESRTGDPEVFPQFAKRLPPEEQDVFLSQMDQLMVVYDTGMRTKDLSNEAAATVVRDQRVAQVTMQACLDDFEKREFSLMKPSKTVKRKSTDTEDNTSASPKGFVAQSEK